MVLFNLVAPVSVKPDEVVTKPSPPVVCKPEGEAMATAPIISAASTKPEPPSTGTPTTTAAAPTASEKLFKQQHQLASAQVLGLQSGDSEETAIVLLEDSDDELELPMDDAAIEIVVSVAVFSSTVDVGMCP